MARSQDRPGVGGGLVSWLRGCAQSLSMTPLHPQWFSFRAKRRIALRVLADATGTVLDLGCGNAQLREQVRPACRYVGLDYPPTGRDWYGARPDVFADAARLPLRDDSFDRVWMLDVLEHLALPNEGLREAMRVLVPGGRLHISIPCMYPLHDEPHDYQRLTEHGLRRSLATAGFAGIEIDPSGAPAETAAMLVNIALAKLVLDAARAFSPALVLLIPLVPIVLVANLLGWALGLFSRHDRFMPCAYLVACSKAYPQAASAQ